MSSALILDCYEAALSGRCLASMANSPTMLRNMLTDTPVRANARLCIGRPLNPLSEHRIPGWRASLIATRHIAPHEEILVPYSDGYVYPVPSAVARSSSPPSRSPSPKIVDLVSSDSSNSQSPSPIIDLCSVLSAEPSPSSHDSETPLPAPPPEPPPVRVWRPPPPQRAWQPPPPTAPRPTLFPALHNAGSPLHDPVAQFRVRRAIDKLPILQSPSDLSLSDRTKLATTLAQARACLQLFPVSLAISEDAAFAMLAEAQRVCSADFGSTAAIQWAQDFQFDPALLKRDLSDFHAADSSLTTLALRRQHARAPHRLSVQRIHDTFGPAGPEGVGLSHQDFNRLLHIAQFGIRVFTPPGFTPCSTPAPLRLRYEEVHCAIHRLLHKQMLDGSVVVLPIAEAQAIPGIHLQNAQHWTTKKGKPQGRTIADLSNTPDPLLHRPLNGHSAIDKKTVTDACIAAYGPITHPTLTVLVLMILSSADRFGWDSITLWKMDLQGAFNLLWFEPSSVPLLAFPLMFGLVAIHLVGLFGWAGMPYAFHVLTRALDRLIAARISGSSAFYVDDLMACSALHLVEADRSVARSIITSLAGPDALATDKDELGRRLDFIGWQICLNTRTVSLSHRNLLKTCHAFFCFQIGDRLPRLLLQRMSSLAIRMSELCPVMRPYTSGLSAGTQGFSGSAPNVRHTLSALTICDIAMWRAYLLLLHAEILPAARPLESFRESPPSFTIEYDASLTGLAAGISSLAPDGSKTLLRFAASHVPFDTKKDSSYQNTCEFLAAILGLLLARSLGLSGFRYTLMGDSRASLAWAAHGRSNSTRARRANIAFSMILLRLDASIADTVHVPGIDNVIYDGLSRDLSASQVGIDPALQLHVPDVHQISRILQLCDPALPLSSPEDHFVLSSSILSLLTF